MRLRSLSAACALILAAATLALAPGPAFANSTQQSILMDDQPLLYTSNAAELAALQRIKDLGVNVVKVSMVWALVAPDPNSTTVPKFDATNPADYPTGAWARYDRLVEIAHQIGLTVYFQLTAPAPLWATAPDPTPNIGYDWSYEPNPQMFGQFVQAVGTRYSGSYVPPQAPQTSCTQSGGFTVTTPGGLKIPVGSPSQTCQTTPPPDSGPLPAVHWWGLWNEPNEIGWLTPQTKPFHGRNYPYSPALDRGLANAGYQALLATGHADDTILLAEIASGHNTQSEPLPFVRNFYCVNKRFKPLRGRAAAALSCPTSGNVRSFVENNPALFAATGFAHHPYSFDHSPATPFRRSPGVITLANLSKLEHTLDRSLRAYHERGGMPLYLTEWGYKTNPPNPYVHTSLAEQADWLNEGEYMTYRMPRVRALAQFLLYDLPPNAQHPKGSFQYWVPFQSGLLFLNGQPKPGYFAYRLPIWIAHARHGRHVTVWGQLRPGSGPGVIQRALIQYRPRPRHSRWKTLARIVTRNPEGYFLTKVRIPHPGIVRLAFDDPAGGTDHSRLVVIH